MENNKCFTCVDCSVKKCSTGKNKYPSFCVSKTLSKEEVDESKKNYLDDEENLKIAYKERNKEIGYHLRNRQHAVV